MKNDRDERISNLVRYYIWVELWLNEENMTTSSVTTLLNITERQLLYWDKKGLKLTRRKTQNKGWRRFSILDLFGFGLVKILRGFRIKLSQCVNIIDYLHHYIHESPKLMSLFASGEYVYLQAADDNLRIFFSDKEIGKEEQSITDFGKFPAAIPLSPILQFALQHAKMDDFKVDLVKDKFGNNNKVIFYIKNEKIDFEELRNF